LSSVKELDVSETALGNAAIPSIAAMPALKKLNLWLTRIDDVGLRGLAARTDLTSLNLDNIPAITDASLPLIATMKELTFLHLGKTSVTPTGLMGLAPLTKLQTLIVTNLGVDAATAQQLREGLPSLTRLDWE
jgi:hypothetical protein